VARIVAAIKGSCPSAFREVSKDHCQIVVEHIDQ
jgi:hypothetical protein